MPLLGLQALFPKPTQPPHSCSPHAPPVPGRTLSRLLRSGQSMFHAELPAWHWDKSIPHGCRDTPLQWQHPALPGWAGHGAGRQAAVRDVGQGSCCF